MPIISIEKNKRESKNKLCNWTKRSSRAVQALWKIIILQDIEPKKKEKSDLYERNSGSSQFPNYDTEANAGYNFFRELK